MGLSQVAESQCWLRFTSLVVEVLEVVCSVELSGVSVISVVITVVGCSEVLVLFESSEVVVVCK